MRLLPTVLALSTIISANLHAQVELPNIFLDEQKAIFESEDAKKFDWVRLKSGEWIKGELKAYYNKEMEFESDVLDTLFIDKDDIYMVLSKRTHAVRFNDGTVLEGALNISGGYVVVGTGPGQYRYADLVSVAPSVEDELSAWTIKVGVGANISKGNTELAEYSASVDIKRRTATNRLLINAIGDRTSSNDEVTENNLRASGTFDWFYTRKLYFRPVSFDYFRDPFQNIAHRYTIGAGVGYYLYDTDKLEWDIGLGPAYQHTEFGDVIEGTERTNSSSSFYIESNTEYELTSDIDLEFDYKFTFSEEAAGGNAQYAKAGASFDITNDIDLDISYIWNHLESPIANADGTIPFKDDYKMVVQLGIEL